MLSPATPFDAARRSGTGLMEADDEAATMSAALYFIFLMLVMGVLGVFAGHSRLEASGEGDSVRQISYAIVTSLLCGMAVLFLGKRIARTVSAPMLLLVGWCWLSLFWAVDFDTSLRRLTLSTLVIASIYLSVGLLGPRKSLQLLAISLGVIMLLNWAWIAVSPNAVHPAGDIENVAGKWRGFYDHKNMAGAVAAISTIVWFFAALQSGLRSPRWLVFLASAIFLVNTGSRTSLALLPVAALAGCCFQVSGPRSLVPHVMTGMIVAALLLLPIVQLAGSDFAMRLMSDPTTFSGRVVIWPVLLAFAADHPLLGAGFGSFWNIQGDSPASAYANTYSGIWVVTSAGHGHNGYLDILVQTGSTGLILAACALVFSPAAKLTAIRSLRSSGCLFALFAFILLHNLLETSLLERDNPLWVVLLIVLAITHQVRKGD